MIDWVTVVNVATMFMMMGTLSFTLVSYRHQRKHHRLMKMRMMFIELWGPGTYEFIKTGKGWHAIGYRRMGSFGPESNDDHEVVVVPWSRK